MLPALGIPAVSLVIEGGDGVSALAHLALLGALPRAPVLQPLQQVPLGPLSLAAHIECGHLSKACAAPQSHESCACMHGDIS